MASLIAESNLHQLLLVAQCAPPGAIVEVGVYQGGSAERLAELGRKLYLYDTFTGIPIADPIDHHLVGDFNDTSLEAVQDLLPGAIILPGVFPETLIDMDPVAFVHADADQYQSTLDICMLLPGRMVDGGIIYFDDYAFPGVQQAIHEVFGHTEETLPNNKAIVTLTGDQHGSQQEK